MTRIFRHLTQSKLIGISAKLGLTIVALWLVFRHVEIARLGDMVERQSLLMLALAAALMFCQTPLGMLRWQLILVALAGGRRLLPMPEIFRISYITAFFTCCLPGAVGGDVVRVWMAKSDHVPLSMAIHSVIIDRLIALAALGLLVMLTLPWLSAIAGFPLMPVVIVLALALVAGIWLLAHIHRLLDRYRHVRVVHWLLYFTDSLKMMLTHRAVSILSLSYGIVSHVSCCLCGYALAHSLGIPITAMQCLTLLPPVLLAAILPLSIGGWGVREAGMIGMMGLIGVHQDQALLLSIQLGLTPMVITLPAGILWLMRRKPAVEA